MGRLKKSRNLITDKPPHFSITETGRVAMSRDNVTAHQAQQGNVTSLFPDYEEVMETN